MELSYALANSNIDAPLPIIESKVKLGSADLVYAFRLFNVAEALCKLTPHLLAKRIYLDIGN